MTPEDSIILGAPPTRPPPKPPYEAAAQPLRAAGATMVGITQMTTEAWHTQLTLPDELGASYAQHFPAFARQMLDGIAHGVDIGFTGRRDVSRDSPNLGSALKDPIVRQQIDDIIRADVAAGKTAGPFDAPPFPHFSVSPIGAVVKGPKVRKIHHLSYPYGGDSINASIAPEALTLGRFDDACDFVRRAGRGCSLTKLDVVAAFKQVPVRIEDRPLLGLKWEGKYYYELVLPFGLRSSGNRWELFAAALHWFFVHHLGIELVIHYVDDYLLVDADHARAGRALTAVLALCKKLGVPMADAKTEGPCTRLVFLGIEIDTVLMQMRLGATRLAELRQLLTDWGGRDSCTLQELQSLTGKLHFAATVVRRGRAYLRRLIDLQTAIEARRGGTPRSKQRLSLSARRDIEWWRDWIAHFNDHSLLYDQEWSDAHKLEMRTDACQTGYGAHYGARWFQGAWTPALLQRAMRKTKLNMPFLEMHAQLHAVATWGAEWGGRKITFRCDCMPVVLAIRRGSSKSSDMGAMMRHLDALAARFGFDYRCEWIPGASNVVADALSRACNLQDLREAYAAMRVVNTRLGYHLPPSDTVPNPQPDAAPALPSVSDM